MNYSYVNNTNAVVNLQSNCLLNDFVMVINSAYYMNFSCSQLGPNFLKLLKAVLSHECQN